MNYYLIDYENVSLDNLSGLNFLSGDLAIIFYSEQRKAISLDILDEISKYGMLINFQKVQLGVKNALDFQLVSYLGFLIGKHNSDDNFYIVSNDKGYDCVCDFWKRMHIDVKRIDTNESINSVQVQSGKKSKVSNSDLVSLDEIRQVISKNDSPEEVLMIFNQYKTKQAISNALTKMYKDSKRAGEIYKKLKPLMKMKKKS